MERARKLDTFSPMSLVPAEILLAATAVFTVIKIAAEQQQELARKPVRVRVDDADRESREAEVEANE